jgi:hypothetical protein
MDMPSELDGSFISRTESDEARYREQELLMEQQQLLIIQQRQRDLQRVAEQVLRLEQLKQSGESRQAAPSDSPASAGPAREEPAALPGGSVQPAREGAQEATRELKDLQALLDRIRDNETQIAHQKERMLSMKQSLDAASLHVEAMTAEMEERNPELTRLRLVEASEVELQRQLAAVESEHRSAVERLASAKSEILQLKTEAEQTSE